MYPSLHFNQYQNIKTSIHPTHNDMNKQMLAGQNKPKWWHKIKYYSYCYSDPFHVAFASLIPKYKHVYKITPKHHAI